MSRLSIRSRLSRPLFAVALLSLGACASPTAPQVADESVERTQNVICVSTGPDGQPLLTEPVGNRCPAGFDLQPWW